ncbi:MAG: hypothetical protein KDB94_03195 [Acidobacteria bacterium]|nr:hypothetical protein [Acidobacteriota bacterium]
MSVTMNGVAYFFVDDGVHGTELWRSDGTALGSYLLRDVCPGRCGSDGPFAWSGLAASSGTLYFAADDGVHGAELWASDGTAGGTRLVRDVRPGIESSNPSYFHVFGGLLYFSANDGVHGIELWRSDGTPAGTHLIAELTPGPGGNPVAHLYEGTGFLFAANGFGLGSGLWRVDGTPGGPLKLLDQGFVGSSLLKGFSFALLPDGRLVFPASDPDHGDEPWISDGTLAGTQRLADLMPGPEDSSPGGFAIHDGQVFFHASASARPGDSIGLWSTTGTEASTVEVPLPAGVLPGYGFNYASASSGFFFAAEDPLAGRELWVLDAGGARRIVDLWPGPDWGVPLVWTFYFDTPVQTLSDRVVFAGSDGTQGLELWVTDGTEGGTTRLTDLAPGSEPTYLTPYSGAAGWPSTGQAIVFRDWNPTEGYRLHRTDGTLDGTVTLRMLDTQTSSLYPAEASTAFSDWLGPNCRATTATHFVFAADVDLVSSDRRVYSVEAASLAVEELPSLGPYYSSYGCSSVAGHGLYFSTDGDLGTLHATDGTTAGTESLLDTPGPFPSGWSSNRRSPFVRHGDGWVGFNSQDWIRTDGTSLGTTVEPTPVSGATWFESLGTTLLVGELEIWRSDGDAASAAPIREAGTDEPWSEPEDFARLGDRLLFTAEHGGLGRELWSTDGTSGGTSLLADVRPGPEGSSSRFYTDLFDGEPEPHVVALDSRAVYAADDGVHGLELWSTDGTPGGTALLVDLYLGAYPSSPRELRRVGDQVFFVAEHPLYGRELFATDGTPEGTHLVRDLVPGAESSVPQALTAYKNLLLFSAWTPQFGREAWRSDGTPEGTVRITDLAPGPESSSPDRFAVVRDRLFFAANDLVHGFELFTLVDPVLAEIFRDGFETGDASRWSVTP